MLALALAARSPTPPSGMTTLVCDPPATLGACKRDCHCTGSSAQPDCGHPDCHTYCRCREATPPPPYKPPTPPPPYTPQRPVAQHARGGHRRALMEREAEAEAFMEFLAEREAVAEAEAEADTAFYGYQFL
ncbi:hypothetical protein MMC30_002478 [Trapelia coarctata]|nr:hypothetical protein [Trapelia coarctata]